MPLSKKQLVKLASEVLARYVEKYGGLPTGSIPGVRAGAAGIASKGMSIKGGIPNPMGIKPLASDVLSPGGAKGIGGGLGKGTGTGGKGAKS
jgi:hypothetical protein